MIQDLAEKIWKNPRFQKAAKAIEKAWLTRELKLNNSPTIPESVAARAISASAILACSANLDHRIAALRLSTYVFELFETSNLPFDGALRVVLTRLGNFPSIGTRDSVKAALNILPWTLAAEDLSASERRSVCVGERSEILTDFQHTLWQDLTSKNSIAFSAPTSGGKSFVLELYLVSLFDIEAQSIVYIVPTRALITQVSTELSTIFRSQGRNSPDIVTVPLREESRIPAQVIYVMTQERIHLSLQSHRGFRADVVIVDEAHSISEGGRGILLQTVIEDLLERNPNAQILFASPTTRNLEAFGRIFQLTNISERPSKEPTVSQNFLITNSSFQKKGKISIIAARENGRQAKLGEMSTQLTLRSRIDQLAHIPIALCKGQANLIYANGADEAEDVALRLSRQIEVKNPSSRLLALAKLAKESVHPSYLLAECVLKGIGFHYANIPTQLRQEIEFAFSANELKYLVCTSTLLQGVNLPAKNIFMLKPTRGQGKPLESADFWNLAGRAGRLRREFQGNIFLINYAEWPKQSLREPKDTHIAPAIETSIKHSSDALIGTIGANRIHASKSKKIELESAFVRLFSDFKDFKLDKTFLRLELSDEEKSNLRQALEQAARQITLPSEVLKRTHNVSVHKQQALYERIKGKIGLEPTRINELIPLHPSDPQSFDSYSNILQLCHEVILGIDTSKRLHRYHALLARRWMLGWSVPRIISERIKREKKRRKKVLSTRKIIRDTLETIEDAIRFQTIRLFGCYKALLEYALAEVGEAEQGKQIPDVELFLEIGASDKTMVGLISLGLSRAVAIRLVGARSESDPELNADEALHWLQSQSNNLASLGLSPLQVEEVEELLSKASPRVQE
jgi:hypothetical protein